MLYRFVEFSIHEYMDEKPHTDVQVFKGETLEDLTSSAKLYAQEMTKAYSGGPTNFVKVYNVIEAKDFINSMIAKYAPQFYNDHKSYDYQDYLEWVHKLFFEFNRCYC